MESWLKWIGGAVVMGLIWAVTWAVAGALIGLADRGGSLGAVWLGPPIGLHPGFVGGVVFAAALAIAARPRRLAELSLPAVVALGGMVGALLGVLPFAINQPPGESPLWLVAAVVIGSMMLMGALSAAGSLALARKAKALRH